MQTENVRASTPALLVDSRKAAAMLSISQRLLFTLTKQNTIPHVRINRRVLYSPDDLRRWIDQQKKGGGDQTPAPLSNEQKTNREHCLL